MGRCSISARHEALSHVTLDDVMQTLRAQGDEKMRKHHVKSGAGENVFGVKRGDIRAMAKEIKVDHDLGLALWQTGNVDAMFLSTLLLKPKLIPDSHLDAMVASVTYSTVADWLTTNVVKLHPSKEALRQEWMKSDHPMRSRVGWNLTTERIIKKPEGLDLAALLDRIEIEMAPAPEPAQWAMNFALAQIGVNHPAHRSRAMEIGEKLGVYRDYPTPKGCTSPFAPIWISEMVKRQTN